MSGNSYPFDMGVLAAHPPTVMADRVMRQIEKLPTRLNIGGRRIASRYWVTADHMGRVHIDRPQAYTTPEWVMTINRQTDPDLLADELREFVP